MASSQVSQFFHATTGESHVGMWLFGARFVVHLGPFGPLQCVMYTFTPCLGRAGQREPWDVGRFVSTVTFFNQGLLQKSLQGLVDGLARGIAGTKVKAV
jgi:hypothetical protein